MTQHTTYIDPVSLEECLLAIKTTRTFDKVNGLKLLTDVFRQIRPPYYGDFHKAERSLNKLIHILREDKRALHKFRYLLAVQFNNIEIMEIFAESGIESEHNFIAEISRRFKNKLLPPKREENSLLKIIALVFYKKSDHKWVTKVDRAIWSELFDLLEIRVDFSNKDIQIKLLESLHIISCRILVICSRQEIKTGLKKNFDLFVYQNLLSEKLFNAHLSEKLSCNMYEKNQVDLFRTLEKCKEIIVHLENLTLQQGTSVQLTYLHRQLKQMITRMFIVLHISNQQEINTSERLVEMFCKILRNENVKNSISRLIRSNIQVLAYQVAEHGRNTGEHYITTSRKDYLTMLKSAMGGGLIAAFIAFIKTILQTIPMAPFWKSFTYSLNYSGGFLTIQLTGSTLATKQPSMTASAIASVLDKKKSGAPDLSGLAILLSQVWRSQTASFVGNLLLVFPISLLFGWLFSVIFGYNMADAEFARTLIDMQNPLKSKCLLFASYTGVFLYLSGLVTGYFDNMVIYGKVEERIKQHPFWSRSVSPGTLSRIASFTGKNLGMGMGNIFLGFALGMAGFFGYIFGFDFDIRHITISAGQFAIGLVGVDFSISTVDCIITIAGILLIGFFNFLVSFTLAFITASISRGIRFRQYRRLLTYLRRLLYRYPFDFIFPPSKPRMPDDLRKRKSTSKEEKN